MPDASVNFSPADSLLDALPCGLVQLDAEDRVVQWNELMQRWTGFAFEVVRGRALIAIYPNDERLGSFIATARATPQPQVRAQLFHPWLIPVPLHADHISGFSEMQQECHVRLLNDPPGHLVITILDVTAAAVAQQRSRAQYAEISTARDRAESAF